MEKDFYFYYFLGSVSHKRSWKGRFECSLMFYFKDIFTWSDFLKMYHLSLDVDKEMYFIYMSKCQPFLSFVLSDISYVLAY